MAIRRFGRLLVGRRFSAASHAAEAVRQATDGRRWSAVRLVALAAVTYRWRAAGMVFELGYRLLRRAR
jgi:hypothetical protein